MTIDCTSVPKWLKIMRSITGLEEEPGSGDNPKIMGMRDWIACTYPEMMDYCEGYTGDDVAWCGLTVGFCVTVAGIRPPFGKTDTDKFLWAQSFAGDDGYEHQTEPVIGSIVVMTRSGGGHVTMFEGWVKPDVTFRGRGGNQSDEVNVSTYDVDDVIAWVWPRGVPLPAPGPGPQPPDDHRELAEGDSGSDVAYVQRSLGLPADGEFGSITDTGVKGFQGACGLAKDGVVGPNTWAALDDLDAKMMVGSDGIADDLAEQIDALCASSPLNNYSWDDRGRAPKGYYPGMAKVFALALQSEHSAAVTIMAGADTGDEDTDALAWYADELEDAGLDTSRDGPDTLRALFVLMVGLGMRESSGNHWEGRDMSASNVESDTAEAGLFQTSWNIRSCSSAIPPLLDVFWDDPNGFRPTFTRGLSPAASQLDCYGSGDGARYQWLSRYTPAFHALVTGVGLRRLRQHWGPINRKEVELVGMVDDLLIEVQRLVEAGPEIA